MKTKMKIEGLKEQRPQQQKKKGVALLTVLTVMSLATILVLTFFTMAQTELESATSYAQGMEAKHLSETAVNMVIGQIRKATTGIWAGGTAPQPRQYSWASQPGVIRNYDVAGTMNRGFKLYSDDKMVEEVEAALAGQDVAELATWAANPAVFVDLNEPVIRGNNVFYPIVDPRARNVQQIEGFDYDVSAVGQGPLAGAIKRADGQADSLPMPVKWLYQLEDGTMGYMQAAGNGGGRFMPIGGGNIATEQNPVVGRVAFWTDDETAKLNVNTAAGGMVWDTPRTGGDIDRNFGRFQPAQKEWQRYPAHPATTSLSPVFFPNNRGIVFKRDAMDMLYELTPRVVGGGSRAGSAKAIEPNGLVPDKDRLYASLDEYIMRPDRTENRFPTEFMKGGTAAELLSRSSFFLTATGRAPEVTLFNTPRVAIWPTYNKKGAADEVYTTPFDDLIRFTAELGNNPAGGYANKFQYYFQRENADSPIFDYNNIRRNREIYAYLDVLMELPVPGFGGSFRAKYGNFNQNQILTEIFDYIRSTNLFDDTIYPDFNDAYQDVNGNNHLTYTNFRQADANTRGLHLGHGQVTPIEINHQNVTTRGFGRFYTISEVGVQLICCADGRNEAFNGGSGGGLNDEHNAIKTGGGGDAGVPYPEMTVTAYSNFPPLPDNFDEVTIKGPTWPTWLNNLYDLDQAKAAEAMLPQNWNYQLVWGITPIGDRAKTNGFTVAESDAMRLGPTEKIVQAALLFKMFSPSQGWVPIHPDFKFSVEGSDQLAFTSVAGPVSFNQFGLTNPYNHSDDGNILDNAFPTWVMNRIPFTGVWGGRHYGGHGGFRSLMRSSIARNMGGLNWWGRLAPFEATANTEAYNVYPWITVPFKINTAQVQFTGVPITIRIYSNRGGDFGLTNVEQRQKSSPQYSQATNPDGWEGDVVQTMQINLGQLNGAMPAPNLASGSREYMNEFGELQPAETSPAAYWSLSFYGASRQGNDFASVGRLARTTSSANHGRFIKEGDTVWSMGVQHADYRLISARKDTAGDLFRRHPQAIGANRMAHTFYTAWGNSFAGSGRVEGGTPNANNNLVQISESQSHAPQPLWESSTRWNLFGDFDNGMGNAQDGPYINKADEGNTHSLNRNPPGSVPEGAFDMRRQYGDFPYFVREYIHEPGGPAYFSPNRIMPGPGVFGSLPSAALRNKGTGANRGAWQTLLFRPDIVGNGYTSHPGALSPKDHLIMDLFWMPVVEPYAISETLSTSGKVNMNYQILPFSYIQRRTALHGVFMSEVMMTVPNQHARAYKTGSGRGFGYHWKYSPYAGTLQQKSMRTFIVPDATLDQFETTKFAQNQIFKSATEICDIFLIPEDIGIAQGFSNQAGTYTPTVQQMRSGKYNRDHAVVGDNGRERPYTDIYPRLTTKSNTYKVHFRAQVLRKAKGQAPDQWDPMYDQVVSEYRGSTVVERYIDPNDPNIPDYAITPNAPSLDSFYRYRVLNTRRFAP